MTKNVNNFWKYGYSKLNYLTNWASTTNYIIHFQWHIIWLKICLKPYISGRSRTRVKKHTTSMVYSGFAGRGTHTSTRRWRGGGGGRRQSVAGSRALSMKFRRQNTNVVVDNERTGQNTAWEEFVSVSTSGLFAGFSGSAGEASWTRASG